jgi:tRNA threonylcarbamoyladenosine biosynthesis protein TsaB
MTENRRGDDPRLLILETSGKVGQVAVARGRRLGQVRTLSESRRHARDLAPTIVELCAQEGWKVRDLDAVIVSLGPGSYTGLRIGIMSVKTLAYASNCVVLGIETFAAIAHRAPREADIVDVIADAQQQNVYVQRWQRNADGWRAERLQIRAVPDWIASLTPEIWVSGPAVEMHDTAISSANPRVASESRLADPLALLELGMRRWQGEGPDDLWALEPLYLRASSAEEKWNRTEAGRSANAPETRDAESGAQARSKSD